MSSSARVNKTRAALTNATRQPRIAGGDVSKSSQVRSTYSALIQVGRNGGRCTERAMGTANYGLETPRHVFVLGLKESVSPAK